MLTFFVAHAWARSPERLAIVMAFTLAFAGLARLLRGVNRSGAVAGGIVCFVLFAGAGPAAFAALGALFVSTWFATRVGHRRKLALGLAESREGRSARQVLANLAVPALGSMMFGFTGNRGWLFAIVAALAEAATDTVASEIGQSRSRVARLITTWRHVHAGTDGGITVSGSAAGVAAGLVIAEIASAGSMFPQSRIWVPVTAGFAGMLFDSILGATLQQRGWIGNQTVNFFATLAAAAIAYGICFLL